MKRVFVGKIGVDSGQIMIVDPCYIANHQMISDKSKWDEFNDSRNFNLDIQEMCSGIVSRTRNGDGEYKIYATYDKGGIKKLEIIF